MKISKNPSGVMQHFNVNIYLENHRKAEVLLLASVCSLV